MTDAGADTELWRSVAGYEGLYEVSTLGRVRSLPRDVPCRGANTRRSPGRVLRAAPGSSYLMVSLSRGGEVRQFAIHRLVAIAFRPGLAGEEVRHLNGKPHDNKAGNLQFGTHAENERDKIDHGTHTWGERIGTSKLRLDQVGEILRLGQCGIGLSALAKRFAVNKSTIHRIATKRTWKLADRQLEAA